MIKLKQLYKKNRLQFVLLSFVYVLLISVSLYHIAFGRRIIPGVTVGGIPLGGKTAAEASNLLTRKISTLDQKVRLSTPTKDFEFAVTDLALNYNVEATVASAFYVGRSGNLFIDAKNKFVGLLKPLPLKVIYSADADKISTALDIVKGEVNQPYVDAAFVLENGEVIVSDSIVGLRVNDQQVYDTFLYSLDNLDFTKKEVLVEEALPTVTSNQLLSFSDEVTQLINNPLVINYEKKLWKLTPEQLLSFVSVVRSGEGVVLGLNKTVFEAYADDLAREVNKLPRGEVTKTEGDKVLEFVLTEEGVELNIKEFTELFKTAYFNKLASVEIPVRTISGPEDTKKYGIVELLGEGVSEYSGSASSRIHNLTLAADRTSGILVPPGEIYSFNKSVGEISGRTGYQSAYVISQGRTVLGDGGGVCQTSTTLFRAVLNSGLPVIKRFPHDYRVRYYEINSPMGLDASIYQPTLDFQFKNDTQKYLLVQAYPDPANSKLIFKIYGTPDGRTVEMTEPVVTNESAPPAPLYQDDPSLPKGVTRQVDFAAWGATATFKRLVKKGEKILYEDTFTTNYRPWRAVFLAGTKD